MKITRKQIESLVNSTTAQEWYESNEKWLYATSLLETLCGGVESIPDRLEDWALEILEECLDQQYLADLHEDVVAPLKEAHEANEELGKNPDWIVAANKGKFYVLDNESLKRDGIPAHAVYSVHNSCAEAKEVCKELSGDTKDELANLIQSTTILGEVTSAKLATRIREHLSK